MKNSNHIFLLGFMGSGKSTLGKKLAKQLQISFFDLDVEIEKHEECSIEELFAEKGEKYFRSIEQTILKRLIAVNQKYVIALGGGTPCFYNNMELINKSGTSIYIQYNAGVLSSRLLNAKTIRPLIKEKTKEELLDFINQTLLKREKHYKQSHHIINNNNIKVEDLLELC